MVLQHNLAIKGFSISNVDESDFSAYFAISRALYEKYVDEYFGGWVDDLKDKISGVMIQFDEIRPNHLKAAFHNLSRRLLYG